MIHSLALVGIVPDLVEEQLLDGVQLLALVEEDCRNADVPAQGLADCRAQQRGQVVQPVKCHLREKEEETESDDEFSVSLFHISWKCADQQHMRGLLSSFTGNYSEILSYLINHF